MQQSGQKDPLCGTIPGPGATDLRRQRILDEATSVVAVIWIFHASAMRARDVHGAVGEPSEAGRLPLGVVGIGVIESWLVAPKPNRVALWEANEGGWSSNTKQGQTRRFW